MRLGKKTKAWSEPKHWPKFCRFDGKPLLLVEQEERRDHDERTGKLISHRRRIKFCPDWQQQRERHTEFFPRGWSEGGSFDVEVES